MVLQIGKVAIAGVMAFSWVNLAAQIPNATTKATEASDNKAVPSKAPTQAPRTSPVTAQILASYEGQIVSSIQIAGRPDSATAQFESLFVQKAGQPFSREKVYQTVEALKVGGKFKEVQIQVDPDASGVRILLILEPAIYFGIYQFPGAERFPYSRLVQVANLSPSAPFNSNDVETDRQSLIRFFQQEGYFTIDVRPEVKVDADHGLANVIFHTTLHRQAKFGVIDITDASAEEAARLNKSLQSLLARGRGAAIRPGKIYQRTTLSRAAGYLQSGLAKRGRLNAQVELQGAEYHADTNRADIHFGVQPGPIVKVDVKGAHLWSWTRKSLLPVYQGIPVDDESVQEGRQALLSYFQAKGYFDTKVDADFKKDDAVQTIVYQIQKNKKHKVVGVQVSGNSRLATTGLMQHVTVQKSHLFSPGNYSEKLVRDSAKNLIAVYESEGFSSVKVVPKIDKEEGNLRVAFQVTEGPRDIVTLHVLCVDQIELESPSFQDLVDRNPIHARRLHRARTSPALLQPVGQRMQIASERGETADGVGISISADRDEQLTCTYIDSRCIRMQNRQTVASFFALLGHFAPPIAPVGCPGRGHRANSQSRSSPETGSRHHTSVRNPRPTLIGRASNRAPMSARAVAVIRPAPTIIARLAFLCILSGPGQVHPNQD
jgi:outer membrane protein assembly factor BamA